MTEREPIGQKLRFEVFKRDSFTCQYCGAKAPDVVLQVDHIHPVAEGGTAEILNLATSCRSCNAGKGARLLSDSSVVERQRAQIEELQERRQQLEWMLQWRDDLRGLGDDQVTEVVNRIGERTGLIPVEAGKDQIRRWIKEFGLVETMASIDEAFDRYIDRDANGATKESWSRAFGKVGAFLNVRRGVENKEALPRLLYIQGILRNRCGNRWLKCTVELGEMVIAGTSVDTLQSLARNADSWDDFAQQVGTYLKARGGAQ